MMSTPSEPRTLSEIGEFGLINRIASHLAMPPSVSVGPGDDAAVFLVNGSAVITVDLMIEGHDFRRDWSSPADVGHKAVASSVADIESMGATPTIMVIGLGAPASLEYVWVKEFMTGVREEADLAGVALVGGDLATAQQIAISVTVVGETAGRTPVLRSGARPGQVVAVRGRLGWASAGLAALARGFRSPRAAVDSQRAPKVPYGAGREAADAGASAMIDVSDGLLADLRHIADASGVGIDLEAARFQIAEPVAVVAAALHINPLSFVLTGGEDHAMAATFDPGRVPADWDVVGLVVEADAELGPLVLVDGHAWEGEQGWTHFR